MSAGFTKNTITLLVGTSLSQAIALSAMPILSRIYSPSEFGVFAVFSSLVTLLALVSTWRFELAIVLPDSEDDARAVAMLSSAICLIMSVAVLIAVILYGQQISQYINIQDHRSILYFVPISMLVIGMYQSLNYWRTRSKSYSAISKSKVTQSATAAGVSILGGVYGMSVAGLVAGALSGQITALISLAFTEKGRARSFLIGGRIEKFIHLLKKYKNQPIYNLPHAAIDGLRVFGINLVVTILFGVGALGFYSMATRILQMPSQLIGNAMGQVFFQEFSSVDAISRHVLLHRFIIKLVTVSSPVFILAYFLAPYIFSIVLGENWTTSGYYARDIVPWIWASFISGPISLTLITINRQGFLLVMGVIYAVLPLTVFYLLHDLQFSLSLKWVSWIMAIFLCLMTFLVVLLVNRSANDQ